MYMNPADYSFAAELEANWLSIRQELLGISREKFMEWPQKFLYESGWNVFGLYALEKKMNENCALCPETTLAVERVPGLVTAGFSWMEPGTHIKAHVGYSKAVLRCHLGLVIPNECALRVGHEIQSWYEGKTLVFDDTTEHEAWNRSSSIRVVLLLDFTRPEQIETVNAQDQMQQAVVGSQ
jgi:aspartyl/asparaginyl beta-hydroxylase (cupin superfamily)